MLTLWGTTTTRTLRPIWIAEELGLEYQLNPMGPRTGETQTEDFTALSAKQKIPVLSDGDFVLSESLAICRYLINKFDGEGVFYVPRSPEEAAQQDAWCYYIFGEIDETGLYVMRRHGDLSAVYGEAPTAMEAASAYVAKHLAVVSEHLAGRDYFMSSFGLADVMLMSCLKWAEVCGLSLSETLVQYQANLSARPAFQQAMKKNYS